MVASLFLLSYDFFSYICRRGLLDRFLPLAERKIKKAGNGYIKKFIKIIISFLEIFLWFLIFIFDKGTVMKAIHVADMRIEESIRRKRQCYHKKRRSHCARLLFFLRTSLETFLYHEEFQKARWRLYTTFLFEIPHDTVFYNIPRR